MKRKQQKRHLVWFWWIMAGALVAIVGISAILYCHWAVAALNRLTFDDVNQVPPRKVGMVLGCSPYVARGRANPFFTYRIAAATALYQAGKVEYLLVSGDNRRHDYNEPVAMKQALINAGVPPQRIVCDYAGFTTLDSVLRARHVFQETRFTIISQRFHTQRALYIAHGYGIDAIGFNAREVSVRWAPKVYFREAFARVRAVWDVKIYARKPHFLGEPIRIGHPRGRT